MTRPNPGSVESGLAGNWLTPWRFAGILGLLIAASFPQVFLGIKTFVVRDFGFFAYPLAYFQRECFWRGELPLWNPYNDCGVPFLAQWNTMPLYPLSLVYLLLPLGWSLGLFCLLHLFLAGMGMYFLARRWTADALAASVAGVVFAFNGLSLNMLMWPSHIATLSWMPWVVLTVEVAVQQGGRSLVVAVLVGTLQMLAGGPEPILLTWLLLVALWVKQVVECRLGGRSENLPTPDGHEGNHPAEAKPHPLRGIVWRFPLVAFLVAGLAAIQLLPFLDLAAHSQRDAGYADTRWSIPGSGWANFLVPMVFGRIWNMGVFFQHNQAWTSSYYLGTGALLLALLAIGTVRDRRVWLLSMAAGAALVLGFGDHTFIYRWLSRLVPQLRLMTYPVKFVILVIFAAPLLAGFALANLKKVSPHSRHGKRVVVLGIALLVSIGCILFWAWRAPLPTDNFPATLRNGLSRAGFLIVTVIVLAGLGRNNPAQAEGIPVQGEDRTVSQATPETHAGPRRFYNARRCLELGLLLVCWLDVLTHEPTQNPTAPPEVYQPGLVRAKLAMEPQPALGQSRAMVAPPAEVKFMQFTVTSPGDNFLVKRLGYFADCNLLDEVPKVNGFFSLYPRECGELMSAIYGSTNADFPGLIDFMSVSQITAPEKFFDWQPRKTFLPMITAGQRPLFLNELDTLRALFHPGFDSREAVLLSAEEGKFVTAKARSTVQVVPGRFTDQRVETEAEATESALVVFSQTHYHPWHAYVDGRPARLLRANHAFQAVEIPAGRHKLVLIYEDQAFQVGAIISGASLFLCLVIWMRGRTPSRIESNEVGSTCPSPES